MSKRRKHRGRPAAPVADVPGVAALNWRRDHRKLQRKTFLEQAAEISGWSEERYSDDFGVPFPSTPELLWTSVSGSPRPPTPNCGLVWCAAGLLRDVAALRGALASRTEFTRALLTQDLSGAAAELDLHVRVHGWSAWLTQSRLTLSEVSGGLEANKKTLAAIDSACTPFVSLLAVMHSIRCEAHVSAVHYDALVSGLGNTASLSKVGSWLAFRTGVNRQPTSDVLVDAIWRESSSSALDRYLAFVKCARYALQHRDPSGTEQLAAALDRLHRELGDPRLRILLARAAPNAPELWIDSKSDSDMNAAVNAYTRGDYDTAAQYSAATLAARPEAFELYELHARATAMQGSTPTQPFPQTSLAGQCLTAVHSVIVTRDALARAQLRKLGLTLDLSTLGDAAAAFALQHEPRVRADAASAAEQRLCASAVTPRLAATFARQRDAATFLDHLEAHSGAGPCSALFRAFLCGGELPTTLPAERGQRWEANRARSAGELQKAARILDTLADDPTAPDCVLSTLLPIVVEIHIERGDPDAAAERALRGILRFPSLVDHFDLSRLIAMRVRRKYREPTPISWPILIHLAFDSLATRDARNALWGAADDYCAGEGAVRPSELAQRPHLERNPALQFFLSRVCTLATLNSSTAFSSQLELGEERIRICEALLRAGGPDRTSHEREISTLIQRQLVGKAVQKVEESRIYVDEEGVVASLPSDFATRYDRFSSHVRMGGLGGLVKKLLTSSVEELTGLKAQAELLVDTVQDRFVYSNEHGLDSYLSVRIRHGTLAGHIRNVFASCELVTLRGPDGYRESRSWVVPSAPDALPVVQDAIKHASEALDALIREVREEWLQIRSPEAPDGMFVYGRQHPRVASKGLALALRTNSHDEFARGVLQGLWEWTEVNLRAIRRRIQDELAKRMTEILESIERALAFGGLDPNHVIRTDALNQTTLALSLSRCRVLITHSIASMANWFQRNTKEQLDHISLSIAAHTARDILQRWGRPGIIDVGAADGTTQVSGRYLSALVDMLLVLMDNAVVHSGLTEPRVQVVARISEGRLELVVENDVAPPGDSVAPAPAASRTPQNLVRKEGGTGYAKVRKILKFDLACSEDQATIEGVEREGRFVARISAPANKLVDGI